MTTVNYPSPVTVNGYACKNCTDVDYAKKNIDPARPTEGPYGVNAKPKPPSIDKPAVTFGGVLTNILQTSSDNASPSTPHGQRVDISA